MSNECEVRLWLGWRTTQLAQSTSGWADFTKSLAETFIPATWEIMGDYGLRTYVPSIFRPSGEEGLPEEVALLCYMTKNDYETSKKTVLGRSYSVMHRAIFEFKQNDRVSKVAWCDKVENDKPYLAPPKGGGKRFDDPDALIHVLLLSSPGQSLSLQMVRDTLSEQTGNVAIWIQRKFALLWIAASAPLDESLLRSTLTETMPGVEVVAFHSAELAPQIDQERGIPIADGHSWHFHRK